MNDASRAENPGSERGSLGGERGSLDTERAGIDTERAGVGAEEPSPGRLRRASDEDGSSEDAGNASDGLLSFGRKSFLGVSNSDSARPQWLLWRSAWLIIIIVGVPSVIFNLMLPTQDMMDAVEGPVVVIVSAILGLTWLVLFIYFADLYRSSWRTEPRFAMVLAVLTLDAFRNVIEGAYIGAAYSGWIALIPWRVLRYLWAPQVMMVSRLMALATALVILWLVLERGFNNLQLREQRSVIMEQRNRELTALQQLAALVSSTLDTQAILDSVCREIVEALAFRSALFCLVDEGAGLVRGAAGYGVPESLIQEAVRDLGGTDILADTVRTGQTEVIRGWDDRFNRETYERYSHANLTRIFAPIQDSQGTVGVVEVTVNSEQSLPDDHRLGLLHSFLRHACTAIRNARLHEKVLWDRERLNSLTRSLEEKNRQVESFVYMVSHDLKAPLVSMQGFLSLMDEECSPALGDDGRFYLSRVRSNTQHLQQLIDQLLKLSRIGRSGATRARIDVEAVVREIESALEPRLRENGITFSVQSPLPTVVAEPTQVRQVFTNLIDNSIKYMGGGVEREIRVEGICCAGGTEYVVSDSGIGIDEEMRERVFQMFQRIPTPGESVEGSGVGLAIVRKIAEAHGGKAWVESNPSGKGSAFHIVFADSAEAQAKMELE